MPEVKLYKGHKIYPSVTGRGFAISHRGHFLHKTRVDTMEQAYAECDEAARREEEWLARCEKAGRFDIW